MRFGIVVAEWNSEITTALLDGAVSTLKKHGVKEKNIVVKHVREVSNLPLGLSFLLNMMILMVLSVWVVLFRETHLILHISVRVLHRELPNLIWSTISVHIWSSDNKRSSAGC